MRLRTLRIKTDILFSFRLENGDVFMKFSQQLYTLFIIITSIDFKCK